MYKEIITLFETANSSGNLNKQIEEKHKLSRKCKMAYNKGGIENRLLKDDSLDIEIKIAMVLIQELKNLFRHDQYILQFLVEKLSCTSFKWIIFLDHWLSKPSTLPSDVLPLPCCASCAAL